MIFLVVNIEGKQHKFSLGVKVYPSQWSQKHQQAIVSWKLSDNDNRNNTIVNEKIQSIIFLFREQKPYLCSGDSIITQLKQITAMGRKPKATIDIIQDLRDNLEKDLKIEASTKKTDCTPIRHLANFLCSKEAERFRIKNYKDLAKTDVFRAFRNSLKKLPRVEDGAIPQGTHRVGYINKVLKQVKTLLKKYAVQEKDGYLSMTDINNLNLSPLLQKDGSFDDNKVYLTDAEVMRLYRHRCHDAKDEAVRELFLLECCTGFRISDVMRLDDKRYVTHCDDGSIRIDIVTQKTKERVKCEVHFEIARQILIKYRGKHFPEVSNYNRRIKKICRECGITELCEQTKHYVGEGKARTEQVEKCELVSSHTGRHTFIVLMRLRDVPCEDIKTFTGHKTLDMILEYSRRMRQADKADFKRLQKEHPEQVVLTCDEASNEGQVYGTHSTPQTSLTASNTPNISNTDLLHKYMQLDNEKNKLTEIMDLKNLLNILGADTQRTAMTNNPIELEMMLYEVVGKLGKEGVNIKLTKEVWNSEEIEYKEKCEKILDIIAEVENNKVI